MYSIIPCIKNLTVRASGSLVSSISRCISLRRLLLTCEISSVTSGSLEHMVNLAEEVTNAVVATKHNHVQLDKSYVVLMELDAVITSCIMMDKHPAELTEIAVLIQRLVAQNNSALFNEVFSLATEPGDYARGKCCLHVTGGSRRCF